MECIVSRVVGGDVSVVGSKLISLNYNLCYECLSIIFDCKRRLLWLLVATWLATSRQLVAIVWQLVANQSSDAYLNMKTGIFLQNPGSCRGPFYNFTWGEGQAFRIGILIASP